MQEDIRKFGRIHFDCLVKFEFYVLLHVAAMVI